jgi:hypothetical protein
MEDNLSFGNARDSTNLHHQQFLFPFLMLKHCRAKDQTWHCIPLKNIRNFKTEIATVEKYPQMKKINKIKLKKKF